MILGQLSKVGADMEKPLEVLHYLYLPSQDFANRVAETLRAQGYQADPQLAADAASNPPNPWLVLARVERVVNSESVESMRRTFEMLAAQYNGDYDGWEAAARP
jgi:Regulator of ribonuclease activity B